MPLTLTLSFNFLIFIVFISGKIYFLYNLEFLPSLSIIICMELIQFLWIIIFLFFSLILILIWSKIIVIHKRLKAIRKILALSRELDEEYDHMGRKRR